MRTFVFKISDAIAFYLKETLMIPQTSSSSPSLYLGLPLWDVVQCLGIRQHAALCSVLQL